MLIQLRSKSFGFTTLRFIFLKGANLVLIRAGNNPEITSLQKPLGGGGDRGGGPGYPPDSTVKYVTVIPSVRNAD